MALFRASSLVKDYAFLDDCPKDLVDEVVLLPIGTLQQRVSGVRLWYDALLAGEIPKNAPWPPPALDAPIRMALNELGVVRFCRGQPDLTTALLRDLLVVWRRQDVAVSREVQERWDELLQLERERLANQRRVEPGLAGSPPAPENLNAATLQRLLDQATMERQQAPRASDDGLVARWRAQVAAWTEIADVFGDLGQLLGRGWDLSSGVLHHIGWVELQNLQRWVAQLPQLREIVRSLGRLQQADGEPAVAETVFEPVRRLEEELRRVPSPHAVEEARGATRSGNIARMLPSEAVLLGHPKLKFVWHARCAEAGLLSYLIDGYKTERVQVEREVAVETTQRTPRPERGPIMVVIDTSGSMHGTPELVAKAIALEAAKTAHAERRKCLLFAFSGPGDLAEQELSLTQDGIGRLLHFLSQSFGGGTDIGALVHVAGRLQQDAWKKADVVVVSDGEWYPDPATSKAVMNARAQDTRFHGVQVGRIGRSGLHELCDPVHEFADWRALAGWST